MSRCVLAPAYFCGQSFTPNDIPIMKKKTIGLLMACCSLLASAVKGQIVIEMPADMQAAYARFAPIDTLDWASMECIYEYRVRDADKSETHFDILQLGREYTKYFGYPRYQVDSVIYRRDINKITMREAGEIYNRYLYHDASPYILLIQNRTKKISYYDRVFTDHYVYTDSAPIAWQPGEGSAILAVWPRRSSEGANGRLTMRRTSLWGVGRGSSAGCPA